ncbi:hypothetical protein EGI22_01690 [Lacihabitans sp. LS3-19]|nr:hypothetical protein [Lacihabitans sp. LS3-19]
MKTRITYNQILQYVVPLTIFTFLNFSIKREVNTEGSYEKLFGFPFSYISGNAGCTFCYEFYFFAFAIDFIVYFIFCFSIILLIINFKIPLKSYPSIIWITYFVIICYFLLLYLMIDINFNWVNNSLFSVKNKSFHFGNYP